MGVGLAASVGSANTQVHGKTDPGVANVQHTATMGILLIGLFPVIFLFLGATFSCCAMHYAHQVTNYLGEKNHTLDELITNKAAAAREYKPLADGEHEARIV